MELIPQAFLLTVFLIVMFALLQNSMSHEKIEFKRLWKYWRVGLFIFYSSFVLVNTLLTRRDINPYRCVFMHFGFRKDPKWNNEIIENILLFIPLILLYLSAFKPEKPWKSALILSVCATCFIELSQLLFWLGNFQFSDMLYNVIGGMIGCGIWFAVDRARRRFAHGENSTVQRTSG